MPGRHLQVDRAVGRRDLDGGAERRLGVGDRNVEHEVGVPALVERRRLDRDDDEEVARPGRRCAPGSPLPFSRTRVPSFAPAGILTA